MIDQTILRVLVTTKTVILLMHAEVRVLSRGGSHIHIASNVDIAFGTCD